MNSENVLMNIMIILFCLYDIYITYAICDVIVSIFGLNQLYGVSYLVMYCICQISFSQPIYSEVQGDQF